MPSQLISLNRDLTIYPARFDNLPDEIAIGDTHGNALLLLHLLICYGVVELSESDYLAFRDIYLREPATLEAADFTKIDAILGQATWVADKKIRFLGDMLCDRGSNDALTLMILDHLHEHDIDYDIMLSNHGLEFIYNYTHGVLEGEPIQSIMGGVFINSLQTLINAIKDGHLDKATIKEQIDGAYLSHLKAFDMSMPDSVTGRASIYTHAPVDLTLLLKMALQFDVTTEACTKVDIANAIAILEGRQQASVQCRSICLNDTVELMSRLNEVLMEMIKKHGIDELFYEVIPSTEYALDIAAYLKVDVDFSDAEKKATSYKRLNNKVAQVLQCGEAQAFRAQFPLTAKRGHVDIDISTKAARSLLTRLIWNRDYSDLHPAGSPSIDFVHGHDSVFYGKNVFTLDGLLGKGQACIQGALYLWTSKKERANKNTLTVDYQLKTEETGERYFALECAQHVGRFKLVNTMTIDIPEGLPDREAILAIKHCFKRNKNSHEGDLALALKQARGVYKPYSQANLLCQSSIVIEAPRLALKDTPSSNPEEDNQASASLEA